MIQKRLLRSLTFFLPTPTELSRAWEASKAIQRRTKRLEKAQEEQEAQRTVVEEANALAQERAAAVAAMEAELQHLKGVHAQLSKKHAELTETAALQARLAEQQEQQQTETQKTGHVLWQLA